MLKRSNILILMVQIENIFYKTKRYFLRRASAPKLEAIWPNNVAQLCFFVEIPFCFESKTILPIAYHQASAYEDVG